jgi:hypothetical protein
MRSLALLLLVSLTACVTLPDGRRALTPEARAAGAAMLSDVLACGLPLALGALEGEPDYLAASACHLRRVGERLGQGLESAPAPTVEHGREVVEAVDAHRRGSRVVATVDEAKAEECEATARARLAGKDGEP